ncbi:MAG: hypothetical protein KatS3mg114_1357 [Planctomycetaceae bacterium]|nr:MAG: hypothetical protein KatS3mg114_1357 [Planctomycetaceae bacterium]
MRLISFLGTGRYEETDYTFEGKQYRSKFVAHALAELTHPHEIYVIATQEAWQQHGEELCRLLKATQHPEPKQVRVPTGGEPQQLWQMFGAIVETLGWAPDEALLDITHGFRMQPFFAAACIEYIQAVFPRQPRIRVVYGEFRKDQPSPIWELTTFLEVLTWSRNLMLFLHTGQADEVARRTQELGRELRRQWAATDRRDPRPTLDDLGRALGVFGQAFVTVRTGALLVGRERVPPAAEQLSQAITQARHEVAQHLPALAHVLDQVQLMVQPLCLQGARLSSLAGQRALIALARLYRRMGRYSEAISVVREGWCTFQAPPQCDQPGTDEFDDAKRREWDKQWVHRRNHPDDTAEVRNDIQHAGFRKHPQQPKWFFEMLDKLLEAWEHDLQQASTSSA